MDSALYWKGYLKLSLGVRTRIRDITMLGLICPQKRSMEARIRRRT